MFDMVVATTVSFFRLAARLHVAGGEEQNGIAVDDVALGIAEERAIGIAVEGDTEIEASGGQRDLLRDFAGMEGSAVGIDVAAGGADVGEFRGDVECWERRGARWPKPRRWRSRAARGSG